MIIMIKLCNITKKYKVDNDYIIVLDNLNLTINNSEILGITGRSGSGKTTLIKILRGIENFDSGTIQFNDKIITSNFSYENQNYLRKKTAIHLQRNFGLWSGPAIENVIRKLNYNLIGVEALPMKDHYTYQSLYEEALSILKLVKLDEKALHSTDQLSGGEKQRLVLARQIAAKPDLLLLDEPVTMTGPDTKQEILDVIKNLNKNLKIPIVVVSHLPEIHLYLDSRLAYLENGKVVKIGEPKDVLSYYKKYLHQKENIKNIYSNNKEVIDVSNINKRFSLIRVGEVLNIRDLNFIINSGEIVTIIGSSGHGKSTLLKILEGLLTPSSGDVKYLYYDYFKKYEKFVSILKYSIDRIYLRSSISIMNQNFSLSMNSSIRDQIKYRYNIKNRSTIDFSIMKAKELEIPLETLDLIYKLYDLSNDDREKLISELEIPDEIIKLLFPLIENKNIEQLINNIFNILDLSLSILDRKPSKISGGEHVRAFIALNLITNPKYLLLDEPFGDLDPVTLRDVTNSLKRINKIFGTTIVIVSHHMDFVKEVSHRTILIEKGSILRIGMPNDICNYFIKKCKAFYLNQNIDTIFKNK